MEDFTNAELTCIKVALQITIQKIRDITYSAKEAADDVQPYFELVQKINRMQSK